MLYSQYSYPEKYANGVNEFISRTILGLLESNVELFLGEGIDAFRKKEDDYSECIADLFPKWFDPEQMVDEYMKLYDMVKSEELLYPDLIKGYILYSLINVEIDLRKDMGVSTVNSLPFHDELLEELLSNECGKGDEEAEYLVNAAEDLNAYLDCLFDDTDFLLFNTVDKDYLKVLGCEKYFIKGF